MDRNLLDQMTPIFRDALDTSDLTLTRELDATQVPKWDSLNHISLIIALESAFAIEFDTEELIGLANVGAMADLIEKKLKAK